MQGAWAESYRLLQAADRGAPLDAEDLERLAIAAYLVGQDDSCEAFTARAHQIFLDRGDREGAARAAFWLGFALMGRAHGCERRALLDHRRRGEGREDR